MAHQHFPLLHFFACINVAVAIKHEEILLKRQACHEFSSDMCPQHAQSFSEITHSLSYIGLFLSPAGQWACENNDYCGTGFWKRGGDCENMNCAAKVKEEGFCSKRMTGCAKSCDCDLGGTAGKVNLMVPDSYDPAKKYPLIIWLHGYTGQASWASSMWKLDKIVDTKNVIVAAPNGGLDDLGFPYWDSGSAFHGRFANKSMDTQGPQGKEKNPYDYTSNQDQQYLLEMLGAIQDKFSVDKGKIWLSGSANGALMAYYMACNNAALFAGVAVHGAGQDQLDISNCKPTKPLHLLQIHGTKDFFKIGDAVQRLEVWADFNGCSGTEFKESSGTLSIWEDEKLPGNETQVFEQNSCKDGGSVTLWKVMDAPHFPWFNDNFPNLLSDWMDSKVTTKLVSETTAAAELVATLQPATSDFQPLTLTRPHSALTMEGTLIPF